MIVKNEEKYLEACLDSVKNVVDEIVVVDTGSTDSTKKIAYKYGAKVYDFEWINDFSAARNFALSKSNGDWILYLDADERLNSKCIDELKKICTARNDKAYLCKIINLDDTRGRPSIMSYVRLFPKLEGVKFEGKIHEQIEPSLIKNKIPIEKSNIEIIHVGYDIQNKELKRKANRNLEILYKEYERTKSAYYAFQIAQSLHILDNEAEAIKYFLEALKDNNLKNEYKATAMRSLAVYLLDQQDLDTAREYIEKSIKTDPYQPLSYLVAAKIYAMLKDASKAIDFVKSALKLNRQQVLTSQNILVDEYTVLYLGLTIAAKFDDLQSLNYFLGLFEKLSNALKIKSKIVELSLIRKLLTKTLLSNEEIESLIEQLNKDNIELFITLFKKNNVNNYSSFIEKALKVLPDLTTLSKEYCLILMDQKQFDKAESLLSKILSESNNDLQAIMYLIAVYLETNQIEKLMSFVDDNKQLLSTNPFLAQKLNTLLQQVIRGK
ncbi:glycosyltransferase [Melioribacteraceae bacterium 4301-Me]|uniref:glycosyltransferase n=1 Tax=Pyranulibacter aquaticus TaxID=3163344 RepID=UPI00359572D5